MNSIEWPEGHKFAFTVFDDTDLQTIENGAPIYDLLYDLGFRTTKSVWPIRGSDTPNIGGQTCEDAKYLQWVQNLQKRGFEIGMHNATYHTSLRIETLRGLDSFREYFGHDPLTFTNHADCGECLYWGDARLSGAAQVFYNVVTRGKRKGVFEGHLPRSPLFWGDLCQERLKYVRNFVFKEINTLKECPIMPYHDPDRPYVNNWFASSDGNCARRFCDLISERNQDALEGEGGACIVYTHFAFGFLEGKRPQRRFEYLMKRFARKNGWFVPVATLLDYMKSQKSESSNDSKAIRRLERQWLSYRISIGGTN